MPWLEVVITAPSPAGGWLTTVRDAGLTFETPPDTNVKVSKLSGALKISVAPDSVAVGSADSTTDVPLTELTAVPLAIPGPTTAEPAVTPALAKLFELVTVVDEVVPLTPPTASRVVKVKTMVAVMAAEVLADTVMVVAVTVFTEVPEAKDAPLAPIAAWTPAVLVQVTVSDLLAAVHPVRLITGSVEKAPVPLRDGRRCVREGG